MNKLAKREERKRPDWRKRVWTTKDGVDLKLWQMSKTHLWNACRLLEEKGLLIWPEVQKIQKELNEGRPSLQLRAKMVLAHADLIASWIYSLRREMRTRHGVDHLGALEAYDRFFSIVEDGPTDDLLQPNAPSR